MDADKGSKFGSRLRELRKASGMSQREVAQKARINFTYLSKIESGAMPPPSRTVIEDLAKILDADKDELITLAGKVPSDIPNILKDEGVLQFLRSSDRKDVIRSWQEKRKK